MADAELPWRRNYRYGRCPNRRLLRVERGKYVVESCNLQQLPDARRRVQKGDSPSRALEPEVRCDQQAETGCVEMGDLLQIDDHPHDLPFGKLFDDFLKL